MAGRYDCDLLFLALKRVGRNDREAEAILTRVDGRGVFEFETDFESARQLAGIFHKRNPLYHVMLAPRGAVAGRILIRIISRCVSPGAFWTKCYICGAPVKKCRRAIPVGNNYRCPVHPNGGLVCLHANLRWVCSGECYELAS